MTSAQPPDWAQGIVLLFVPARRREGVLGDLLEEYYEAQLPARGPAGADWWYVRQAFGFLWRSCLPWGLLISAVMIGRDFYDLALPTANFHVRAQVTTYASISLFLIGGFLAARRSRNALSGTALGFVAGLITCAIGVVYALSAGQVLLNSAFAANPQVYGPLVEAADIPVLPIMILGTAAGSLAGVAGQLIGSSGSRDAVRS